jgi:hypothetical protein
MNARTRAKGRRLRSAPFLSPCRLWLADNGHINARGRPGDVDSLALSDRGLGVTRRNVYDPTIVRRRRIVLALGGERRDAKANNECGDEKNLRHLATFLCGRTNQPQYGLRVPSVGFGRRSPSAPQASCRGSREGTNITPRKDSRVVPFIHASRCDTCLSILPGFIDPAWPREISPLGALFLARGFLHCTVMPKTRCRRRSCNTFTR